MYKHRCEII